jgi:hypothetical protein
MKMRSLLILFILAMGIVTFAQVAINNDNSSPDPSAMLDVKSTDKGLLIPRMTQVQRNAIVSPATGLTIFQTDVGPGIYYNAGTPAIPAWSMAGGSTSQWLNSGSNIYYDLGYVGIGTSTMDAKLSLANTSITGIATTGTFQIGQSNTYNLVCDNNEVQARYNGTGSTLYLQYWGGDIYACASGGTSTFSGPVNMYNSLNVSGRIGVKTIPSYDLHINSTDYSAEYIYSPYNGGTVTNIIAAGTTSGTWGLYAYATTAGYAAYFSGNVYCSGSYLPSDEKLKENLQPLENALDKVMKLDVKTYHYKASEFPEMNLPTNMQYGFTAQNLEATFPELVKLNPAKKEQPEEFKAVNYMGMIPILTEAIQEQQKQMDAKDAKLDQLQKQIDELKALVAAIQQN